MPTYDWQCACGRGATVTVPVDSRNDAVQCSCGAMMTRALAAPLFKFAGRITPGGGPDKFTADMLGIPLKELPDGLRTPVPPQ